MTSPFLQLPKSWDGLSPREMLSYERTTPPGEETLPPGLGGLPNVVTLPISDGNLMTVLIKQPEAQTAYWPYQRPWFPAAYAFNQVRLIADVHTAGAFGSNGVLEYSADPDDADSWETPGADGVAVLVQFDAPGPQKGAWVFMDADIPEDVVWRVQGKDGDGATTPIVGKIHAQFRRSAVVPLPPETEPGDYPEPLFWSRTAPEDPMWTDEDGTNDHPRTNGTDVGRWSDKTGNGWHFITAIFASLAPRLNTAVTERGIPSIEFAQAVGGFFGQNSDVFAGKKAASIALRVKMKHAAPPAANKSGYYHYGRNRVSNDTAHPWVNGNHFESFGRSFQINLGGLPNNTFTDWHTYIVAFDHLATRVVNGQTVSRPYSIFFNGVQIVANVTDPDAAGGVLWPTTSMTNAQCYLGRSLSHLGDFYINEVMGWDVELTPAQAAAVHAHMSTAP